MEKVYHPIFKFTNELASVEASYGLGHKTPDAAYEEGFNHSQKYPKGQFYDETDTLLRFTGFVRVSYTKA